MYELREKYKYGLFTFHGNINGRPVKKMWSEFTDEEIQAFLKEHSQKDIDKFFKLVESGKEEQQNQSSADWTGEEE